MSKQLPEARRATARAAKRRKRGRPAGEGDFDSRDALLRSAHDLFIGSQGQPVPLSAICERAGVDVAMIHYHFASRTGLMTSLFERLCVAWAHELENLLALEVSPRRKLEIHVRQMIRNYRRYPYTNRVMMELVTSSKPALAKRLSRNFARPLVEFYGRLISQGVAAGEFRVIDPMYFFCSVVGLCEFFFSAQPVLGAAYRSGAVDEDAESAFIQHTTALVLDGVGGK